MADLDKQIRDRLPTADLEMPTILTRLTASAAVLAVLDLHKVQAGVMGLPRCCECGLIRIGASICPTVRAIADALGCGDTT